VGIKRDRCGGGVEEGCWKRWFGGVAATCSCCTWWRLVWGGGEGVDVDTRRRRGRRRGGAAADVCVQVKDSAEVGVLDSKLAASYFALAACTGGSGSRSSSRWAAVRCCWRLAADTSRAHRHTLSMQLHTPAPQLLHFVQLELLLSCPEGRRRQVLRLLVGCFLCNVGCLQLLLLHAIADKRAWHS
jgi:hypothetical protein